MRIAFLGTPQVAVPALEAFVATDDVEVVAVVTNPDRAKGRSRTPVPPPVKVAAKEADIEVLQPDKPRQILPQLEAMELDAAAVVAYGALLPEDVLAAGGRGMVNLHFSLLPRWRGAAPVQHAIRAGDATTGVSTFVLDKGMDTGPLLDQQEVTIQPEESSGQLLERLAVLGAPVLVESVRRLVAGQEPRPQPADGATLASKITPDDVAIDFTASAVEVANLVRSADPAPGAHTRFREKRLKVYAATVLPEASGEPGTIVERAKEGVIVACGEGSVQLKVVQPEGKGRIDGAAFANGYQPKPGEAFGAPA